MMPAFAAEETYAASTTITEKRCKAKLRLILLLQVMLIPILPHMGSQWCQVTDCKSFYFFHFNKAWSEPRQKLVGFRRREYDSNAKVCTTEINRRCGRHNRY